jgi:hypothetical protein
LEPRTETDGRADPNELERAEKKIVGGGSARGRNAERCDYTTNIVASKAHPRETIHTPHNGVRSVTS